jgi:hypothetical protein
VDKAAALIEGSAVTLFSSDGLLFPTKNLQNIKSPFDDLS